MAKKTRLVILLLLAILLPYFSLVATASFPPRVIPIGGSVLSLSEDNYIVYKYSVISANGSIIRTGFIVFYVVKASNNSITYLLRELGKGDKRCSLLRGGAVLETYLGNGSTIVVNGSKPFIDFISVEDGTTTVAEDINYYGARGWGEISYIGSVLESADIRVDSPETPCKRIRVTPVDSNIEAIELDIGSRAHKQRIDTLSVLRRVLPHEPPLKNLPYREGDYIYYRIDFSIDNTSCTVFSRLTIAWINGPKIYMTENDTGPLGTNCSEILLVRGNILVIDVGKTRSTSISYPPPILANPKLSGNYTIRIREDHPSWFLHVDGWAAYVKGVLYAARWREESMTKIMGNITVKAKEYTSQRVINSSIPVIEEAIKHGLASVTNGEASRAKHYRECLVYGGLAAATTISLIAAIAYRRKHQGP